MDRGYGAEADRRFFHGATGTRLQNLQLILALSTDPAGVDGGSPLALLRGMTNLYETPMARVAISCAIEVHSVLGSGLLASPYERCFGHELTLRGISFRRQLTLPLTYKGLELGAAYRVDFLIADGPLIEIKAVERLLPIHTAQVLTYLKLLRVRQGLIINFNVPRLKDGIRSLLARPEWYQEPAPRSP